MQSSAGDDAFSGDFLVVRRHPTAGVPALAGVTADALIVDRADVRSGANHDLVGDPSHVLVCGIEGLDAVIEDVTALVESCDEVLVQIGDVGASTPAERPDLGGWRLTDVAMFGEMPVVRLKRAAPTTRSEPVGTTIALLDDVARSVARAERERAGERASAERARDIAIEADAAAVRQRAEAQLREARKGVTDLQRQLERLRSQLDALRRSKLGRVTTLYWRAAGRARRNRRPS